MTYTTATLTGTYEQRPTVAAVGWVDITPNYPQLIDAEGDVILVGTTRAVLDGTGHFSVTLPSTDDATVEPATGRQYTIQPTLAHATTLDPIEGVTLAGGTTVDVSSLASSAATAAEYGVWLTEDEYEADLAAAATDATTKANAAQAAAIQRANHTGTQSADTLTDGTTNKAYLATERTKLAGVATAATANDSDANLKARANHTGTQAASTISDLAAAVATALGGLTIGQSTMDRRLAQGNSVGIAPGTGNLRLTYFTSAKTESINSIRILSSGTASSGVTLARLGIYTVAGNGDLTLAATTTSDTALLGSTNTAYTKTLNTSVALTAGTRYAVGLLVVGTTPGSVQGITATIGTEMALDPRLTAFVASQADLPASVANASLTASTAMFYAVLLP